MTDGIRITDFDAVARRERMDREQQASRRSSFDRSSPPLLRVIDPRMWAGTAAPERRWIVPDILPVGAVTMLGGDGGLGKSLITLQLLASTALGSRWLGIDTIRCRTFGLYCEDEEDELHRRLADIAADLGQDLRALDGISLLSRVGEDNSLMEFDRRTEKGTPTRLYGQIRDAARDAGARLVVLDSLHDLFSGNENARPQARQFVQALRRVALDIDGAVILCAHPSLSGLSSGSGISGSTAWNNAVRSRLYLKRPDGDDADPDARLLSTMKANYGPSGREIMLRWERGVFVRDLPESSLVKNTRANAAEDAFLACLDMAHAQGRPASDTYNSPRFAPKLFASLPPGRGFKPKDFQGAMERLFASGSIVVSGVKGADRHDVKAIVRGPK